MAKEALSKIRQAEDQASELIKTATQKAGQISDDALSEAQAEAEAIIKDANQRRENIIEAARDEAKKQCAPLIEEGKDEARHIANPDRGKFELAVKTVTERIVNVHGNSKNEPLHSISL